MVSIPQNPTSLDMLQNWQDAWLRAVAKAWKDPQYKADLLKDPKKQLAEKEKFKLPDGVSFRIVDGSGGTSPSAPSVEGSSPVAAKILTSHPKGSASSPSLPSKVSVGVTLNNTQINQGASIGFDIDAKKWILPDTVLVATLPPPPPDPSDQAIALSHYVDTSDTFPFTTC